jgi:hypothetical protein
MTKCVLQRVFVWGKRRLSWCRTCRKWVEEVWA